mgnify:CR=1 FL=1
MFGYITINLDELKIKDYKTYRAFYCGVCQELKESHGRLSRLTLTYDMTFLAILLSGLYEGVSRRERHRCLPHPLRKHECVRNPYTAYAADMNLLLCYYDLLDDWDDERKLSGLLGSLAVRRAFYGAARRYPRQYKAVRRYLKRLKACEAAGSRDLDLAAGYTGELFAEIFAMREDPWRDVLGRIGFQLGKFIYLMDAWEDVERDGKRGSYNPFLSMYHREDFDIAAEKVLLLMASDAAREFEKLPITEYVDILRNILYCGIWNKFRGKKNKKEGKNSVRSL